jgi:hypothetical protein
MWIGVVSPLVACGTGTLEIGDGLGSVNSDASIGGEADSSGDVEGEESGSTDPQPEVEPYAFAGTYSGMVEIFLWGNGWNICRVGDEVRLEVDEEGALSGEGTCKDGFGTYPMAFEGSANDDGRISGEVLVEVPWERNSIEERFEFGGWLDEDGLWIEWDSAIEFDGWDMPVAGEVSAE